MALILDLIDELCTCLSPLHVCTDSLQNNCVEPVRQQIIDPLQKQCVDPILRALEINPLGCVPVIGIQPSLPQYASPAQQESRARQLARTQYYYQYDYSLVRTFTATPEHPDGVQGEGIAILAKVPLSQLPPLWWLCVVVRQALIVVENFLAVLEFFRSQLGRRTGDILEHEGDTETFSDFTHADLDIGIKKLRSTRSELRATLTVVYPCVKQVTGMAMAPGGDKKTDGAEASGCSCLLCDPEKICENFLDDIKGQLNRLVEIILYDNPIFDRRANSIQDYNNQFQKIPLPEFAYTFQDDEIFALQRVAGQNPLVIRKWTQTYASQLPVKPYQYKEVMGEDDSLQQAIEDQRLYVCDYKQLDGTLVGGTFVVRRTLLQKYLNAPIGLFALDKSDRNIIKAVAIQANQKPDPLENPIITPSRDPKEKKWEWEAAKTVFQNADCNDSEYYNHLGLAHLLTEAFILATYRRLPQEHPLYVLMVPNFEVTLFVNNTAVTSINNVGSPFNITEAIFSGTVPAILGIAANAVHRVNFTDNMLPNQLKEREIDNPELFPNYPYRDDALLIWNAIHTWVTDYVTLYYTSDRDVTGDYELQSWADEVSSQQGGRIKGVGDGHEGCRMQTVAYLIDAVTAVIYTASAHHALCNFPLDTYELYAPGWPGALFKSASDIKDCKTQQHWLDYLAPLSVSILQQLLGFVIGTTYYTRLGEYPLCHFTDDRVRAPLRAYQQELKQIEEVINKRNETRCLKYPFLLPSRIPQSVNI